MGEDDYIEVTVTVSMDTGGNPTIAQLGEFADEVRAWGALFEPYVRQDGGSSITSTFRVARKAKKS